MLLPAAALLLLLVPPSPFTGFRQVADQAAAARESGRLAEAIDLYQDAVKLRPSWSEGWWYLGTLLFDGERFAEALPAFEHVVRLVPNNVPALPLLGICEYEAGSYEAARSTLARWAAAGFAGPPEIAGEARFRLALLLTRSGAFERSLALLEGEAMRGQSSPPLKEALGLATLRIRALPHEYAPADRERIYLAGSAHLHAALREFSVAGTLVARLLKRYGDTAEIDYFAGTVYLRFDRDLAASAFRRELARNLDHVPALVQIAEHHLSHGDAEQALVHARRGVELDAGNFAARAVLGRVLFELSRYRESAGELEIARRIAPDSPAVRYALARSYEQLGRRAEAERELAAFTALKDAQK